MQRILIIGNAGAGKSTFARALSLKLDLPLVHLDKLFWRGDWETVSRDEFDRLLQAALEKPQWIIDGNFSRTMDARLAKCDTIIYLDYSRWVCLWGMFQRVILNRGKVRPDMAEGCPERFDLDFLKWVWNFNKKHRENTYRLLNETAGVETIVLKNRRAVKLFLKRIDEGEYNAERN